MKPSKIKKPRLSGLSLGGHRNLTILIVSLILFISGCVYFVNAVVLTNSDDPVYRAEAESKANLLKFNETLLSQAQEFTRNTNNTDLPAGRINPLSQ